jgi:hypothetical protein
MINATFPRQDVPLYKKVDSNGNLVPAFAKQHLDYSEALLQGFGPRRGVMDRLYQSYNGIKLPGSLSYLEKNYGKQNKSKYISYRLGRTKMNLLHGEFLKRPLTATVTTTNIDAVSEKMRNMDVLRGAMIARKEVEDIKNIAGVDLMEGVQIPKTEDEFEKMQPKDKDETIMQIILDASVPELKLKHKLSQCFLDLLITAMCYCKVTIDEEGEVTFDRIDPRDAIYEQIEGDDYLRNSPIRGSRQRLFVHDILLRYRLTPEERDILDTARQNPDYFINQSRGFARMVNGQLQCDVIHIEWDSVETEYYEYSPKTKIQMEIDPRTDSIEREIYPEKSDESFADYQKQAATGKKFKTKFKTVQYEATRIAGRMM